MSVNTDAILGFGIDFGMEEDWGENQYPWQAYLDDDTGPQDWLGQVVAAAAGLKEPEGEYDESTEKANEYGVYWQRQWKAGEKCGLKFVAHCSDECRGYFLALSDTVQEASRGCPIEPTMRVIMLADVATLRLFCETHGIKYQEPKWFLASDWS